MGNTQWTLRNSRKSGNMSADINEANKAIDVSLLCFFIVYSSYFKLVHYDLSHMFSVMVIPIKHLKTALELETQTCSPMFESGSFISLWLFFRC